MLNIIYKIETSGVPQGFHLALLLFNLFVNDIKFSILPAILKLFVLLKHFMMPNCFKIARITSIFDVTKINYI